MHGCRTSCVGAPHLESCSEHRLPHSAQSAFSSCTLVSMRHPGHNTAKQSTNPPTTSTSESRQPSDPPRRSSLAQFKLISLGLVLFLGISWILAQTTSLGDQVGRYLPGIVKEKMVGKRTVGYFVSHQIFGCGAEADFSQVNW